jgi:hypothetical protein
MTIDLLLLVLALIAFVASAFGVTAKVNLQSVGLALFVLSLIV